MKFISSLFVLSSFWIAASKAEATDYKITSFSLKGTGCESGTYSAGLIEGAKGFTANFTQLTADSSGKVGECAVTLKVKVPKGYKFQVPFTVYDFSFQLAPDDFANIALNNTYFFPGQAGVPAAGSLYVSGGPAKQDHSIYGIGFGYSNPTVVPFSPCATGEDIPITLTTHISAGAPADAVSSYTVHQLAYGANTLEPAEPAAFILEKC